jgi:hypothetical protein
MLLGGAKAMYVMMALYFPACSTEPLLQPHTWQFSMLCPRFDTTALFTRPHRHCIRQGRISIGGAEAVIIIHRHCQPCRVLLAGGERGPVWQGQERASAQCSRPIWFRGQDRRAHSTVAWSQ